MSSYKDYPLSRDTPPEVEKVLFELLSKKTPAEKFRMTIDAIAAGRTLVMSGLRGRHPNDTEEQLKVRFVELLYGKEAAEQVARRLTNIQADDQFIEVTFLVIEVFEKLGINYLIGGSLASGIHGEPRFTRDADLLADIKSEHIDPLYNMLAPEFNIAKEAIQDTLRYRSSFCVIHFQSLFKVDIFVPKPRQFDEQQFQRRSLHVMTTNPERRAYVATAEDTILAKLEWYRLGNEISEQRWRDILGIFKANQGGLDVHYMESTAKQLGVLDLLHRLLPDD
jgi:hypothetical protein